MHGKTDFRPSQKMLLKQVATLLYRSTLVRFPCVVLHDHNYIQLIYQNLVWEQEHIQDENKNTKVGMLAEKMIQRWLDQPAILVPVPML